MPIGNDPSGYKVKASIAKELDYGTPPANGWVDLLFTSIDIGSENTLEQNPSLGQGRDMQEPIQNPDDVRGQMGFVLDPRRVGILFAGLFGDPVSTDETTHWQHVFKTGNESIPSYSIEQDLGLANKFKMVSGLGIDAIDLSFARSGFATATIDVIGQKEVLNAVKQATGSSTLTDTPFSNFKLGIKRDGVDMADVRSASLRFANNLETKEHIRKDGVIDGLGLSQSSITGNLTLRFTNMDMFELATNKTPITLEFAYEISETLKLVFNVHRVFLPKPKLPINGPAGIEASFAFEASIDPVEGCAMTVTLLNDIDDTVY